MTKEELYEKYNGELHDQDEFFQDLNHYYDTRLVIEAQKFLDIIKGDSCD